MAETTLTQMYIFLKVLAWNLPETTFPWTCTCQKLHFPERALAGIYIFQNMHLPEITLPRRLMWQKLHLPEFAFSQKLIFQNLHLPELIFGRPWKLIFQNLHLPEFTFGRNYTFPRKLMFQKLYLLAQNFIIDRIYITKICNYDCWFSKIITRRTKGAKECIFLCVVTNFDKQR